MEKYNYEQAIYNDVYQWLKENFGRDELMEHLQDLDDFRDYLNDALWIEDSVTGNASGSYFFNAWKAEEALCHNFGLYFEALREFGETSVNISRFSAESADVTIRCYLLPFAIDRVLAFYIP